MKEIQSLYKTNAGEKRVMEFYDSVLRAWPVPYETKTIPTRHGATFVIVSGSDAAPALLLLHGANSNASSWVGDILEYSRHFRVFAVDIPGEPGKSAPNRPSWQGLEYAEWLDDVLNELPVVKPSLVGLSQGAWIAIRFATCHPERVEKLVLLTPAGIVHTKASFILKAVFYSCLGKTGAKKINRMVVAGQPLPADALEFMDLILTHFRARIDKEYIFTDAELMRLQMPVLLIGGTEDVVRPSAAIAARMSQCVPGVNSLIIPHMGHVLVDLARRIVPFLNGAQ